jgi:glycerophosphoryl diester phosphodiesterase
MLDWLTARPIAHRGLHDAERVESTASAITAAIEAGYGIEVDLQVTADGEAMVHHDDRLGRLTEGEARLSDLTAAALRQVRFKTTTDRMLSLGELCDLVAGRSTLLLELKGAFDNDLRVAERTVDVLKTYRGPAAVMSFDPRLVAALRHLAPALARGITAMGAYDDAEWAPLSHWQKATFPYLLHAPLTRPHFVAYALADLPALAPTIARSLFGRPLLAWVARRPADRTLAKIDQIIFEDFRP